MKHRNILTLILLLAAFTLVAQSNYSPCYTNNMSKGNTAFSQGKYSEARTYYVNAKQCNGGNPSAAQQKINACDAKIKAQKEATEAKRKAKAETTEAQNKKPEEKNNMEESGEKEEESIAKAMPPDKKQETAKEETIAQSDVEKKQDSECNTKIEDYDGNTYNVVKIGNQCWMKENLRTRHYANGVAIIGKNELSFTIAYYCPAFTSSPEYGLLYNWKAVMGQSLSSNSNPSKVQGICPNGWHVPSNREWQQLIDYVSNQSQYCCLGDPKRIGKALAATYGWAKISGRGIVPRPKECNIGNSQQNNDATGFSALPAGGFNDHYFDVRFIAEFWTSFEYDEKRANTYYLYCDDNCIKNSAETKSFFHPVRCVRD